jgi:hypothetical protein
MNGKEPSQSLTSLVFSDDLYVLLRSSLLERARDKETPVRIQAALGLAKLRSGEDPDDLEEDEENLDEVLLDLLRFDAAPYVIDLNHRTISNIPNVSEKYDVRHYTTSPEPPRLYPTSSHEPATWMPPSDESYTSVHYRRSRFRIRGYFP